MIHSESGVLCVATSSVLNVCDILAAFPALRTFWKSVRAPCEMKRNLLVNTQSTRQKR